MPAIVIGDVVEVIQTWDMPLASLAQNVWHLEMVSGAGGNTDDILAQVLTQQQVAFALVAARINNGFEVVQFDLRLWDPVLNRYDGVDSIAATGMVGTSASDFEPHGVAIVGRILTEFSRRQGRTFLPGFIDASVAGGLVISAAEADMVLYLATFDTDISIAGALLSWCTFNTDPLSPVFESTSVAIQTVLANSLPSYLTKRKPGVGL